MPLIPVSGEVSTSSSSSYNFNGGYSITNTNNKGYATAKSATIKYSADVQYTIVPPAGKAITAVTFSGYANYDEGSYLKEVNGTTYGETVYPFIHDSNKSNFRIYSIPFSTPVAGPLTFTPGNKQTCLIITLTVSNTTGIDSLSPDPSPSRKGSDGAWYTLDGRKLSGNPAAKGLYIVNGRKVVIK